MSIDIEPAIETTMVAPQVLLVHHFNALKLPTFAREYEKIGADCAREGVVTHAIYYGCANWNVPTVNAARWSGASGWLGFR